MINGGNGQGDGVLDLARRMLDRQIIDADEIPCGKVDDIEFDRRLAPGEPPRVMALLVSPRVAAERLPALLRPLFRRLTRDRIVRVPWDQITEIKDQIKLKSKAGELGLSERDTWSYTIVARLPYAWKAPKRV